MCIAQHTKPQMFCFGKQFARARELEAAAAAARARMHYARVRIYIHVRVRTHTHVRVRHICARRRAAHAPPTIWW